MTTTAPGGGRTPRTPSALPEPGAAGRSGAHPAPPTVPDGPGTAGPPPTAPLTAEAARRMGRTPGSRFHPDEGRATMGAAAAAKAVAEDLQGLVRAEIAYARSEVTDAAKAKGMGIGLLAAAGVVAWLALQGVLITIGFGLAAAGSVSYTHLTLPTIYSV